MTRQASPLRLNKLTLRQLIKFILMYLLDALTPIPAFPLKGEGAGYGPLATPSPFQGEGWGGGEYSAVGQFLFMQP